MDPELGGRGPPEISRPPLGGHVGSWSPSAHLSRVFKRRRRVLAQWFVSLAASPATGPFDTPPAPAARAADGNLLGREEAAGAGPPWAVTGRLAFAVCAARGALTLQLVAACQVRGINYWEKLVSAFQRLLGR